MAISDRYNPPHPPNEQCVVALDLSPILPPGVGLVSASVSAFTNTNPANPTADLTFGPVSVQGRRCYTTLTGGTEGTDYIVQWTATDSLGNVWPRSCYLLCARTS